MMPPPAIPSSGVPLRATPPPPTHIVASSSSPHDSAGADTWQAAHLPRLDTALCPRAKARARGPKAGRSPHYDLAALIHSLRTSGAATEGRVREVYSDSDRALRGGGAGYSDRAPGEGPTTPSTPRDGSYSPTELASSRPALLEDLNSEPGECQDFCAEETAGDAGGGGGAGAEAGAGAGTGAAKEDTRPTAEASAGATADARASAHTDAKEGALAADAGIAQEQARPTARASAASPMCASDKPQSDGEGSAGEVGRVEAGARAQAAGAPCATEMLRSPADWARVRGIIVRQQAQFATQVSELHSLVEGQRQLCARDQELEELAPRVRGGQPQGGDAERVRAEPTGRTVRAAAVHIARYGEIRSRAGTRHLGQIQEGPRHAAHTAHTVQHTACVTSASGERERVAATATATQARLYQHLQQYSQHRHENELPSTIHPSHPYQQHLQLQQQPHCSSTQSLEGASEERTLESSLELNLHSVRKEVSGTTLPASSADTLPAGKWGKGSSGGAEAGNRPEVGGGRVRNGLAVHCPVEVDPSRGEEGMRMRREGQGEGARGKHGSSGTGTGSGSGDSRSACSASSSSGRGKKRRRAGGEGAAKGNTHANSNKRNTAGGSGSGGPSGEGGGGSSSSSPVQSKRRRAGGEAAQRSTKGGSGPSGEGGGGSSSGSPVEKRRKGPAGERKPSTASPRSTQSLVESPEQHIPQQQKVQKQQQQHPHQHQKGQLVQQHPHQHQKGQLVQQHPHQHQKGQLVEQPQLRSHHGRHQHQRQHQQHPHHHKQQQEEEEADGHHKAAEERGTSRRSSKPNGGGGREGMAEASEREEGKGAGTTASGTTKPTKALLGSKRRGGAGAGGGGGGGNPGFWARGAKAAMEAQAALQLQQQQQQLQQQHNQLQYQNQQLLQQNHQLQQQQQQQKQQNMLAQAGLTQAAAAHAMHQNMQSAMHSGLPTGMPQLPSPTQNPSLSFSGLPKPQSPMGLPSGLPLSPFWRQFSFPGTPISAGANAGAPSSTFPGTITGPGFSGATQPGMALLSGGDPGSFGGHPNGATNAAANAGSGGAAVNAAGAASAAASAAAAAAAAAYGPYGGSPCAQQQALACTSSSQQSGGDGGPGTPWAGHGVPQFSQAAMSAAMGSAMVSIPSPMPNTVQYTTNTVPRTVLAGYPGGLPYPGAYGALQRWRSTPAAWPYSPLPSFNSLSYGPQTPSPIGYTPRPPSDSPGTAWPGAEQGGPLGLLHGMPQGVPQGMGQGGSQGGPMGASVPQGMPQGMPQVMPNGHQLAGLGLGSEGGGGGGDRLSQAIATFKSPPPLRLVHDQAMRQHLVALDRSQGGGRTGRADA